MFNQLWCEWFRKTEVVSIDSRFPKPDVVSNFEIHANDYQLVLRYSSDEQTAIITFTSIWIFKFGIPNDEAMPGHPLFSRGLRYYEAQKVSNSTWIDQLEKQNRVHHQHNSKMFEDLEHLIFTGQDNIFECVVGRKVEPQIQITDELLANKLWREMIGSDID